jgi:hypothetical protein
MTCKAALKTVLCVCTRVCICTCIFKVKVTLRQRFTANQFVLAPNPLRLTTRNFLFQLNPCGYSPYVTSSLTRYIWGRDSSVGIATGYGLDDRCVGLRVPVRSRSLFSTRRPDLFWGSIQWVPGVKRLGHEADYSPPSSGQERWSYPPYVFMPQCLINEAQGQLYLHLYVCVCEAAQNSIIPSCLQNVFRSLQGHLINIFEVKNGRSEKVYSKPCMELSNSVIITPWHVSIRKSLSSVFSDVWQPTGRRKKDGWYNWLWNQVQS